jgi:Domain of unknown function (DUF4388)
MSDSQPTIVAAMLSTWRKNMGIAGNLATMSVADLLQFLETGQKSGVLRVSRESVTKEIFFEKGSIIGSTSTDPKEYFGQFLLHYGKIDEAQLRLALESQRHQRQVPLGRILLATGVFNETEMMELLRLRALEIMYELFLWEQADFQFEDQAPLPENLIRIEIKPTSVMMEGVYRTDEWLRYREVLPSDRVVLGLVPGRSPAGVKEGSDIPRILWFVKKRMTVGEICYNMHASPFHVYSRLHQLVTEGVIQVVEAQGQPTLMSATAAEPEVSAETLQQAKGRLARGAFVEALTLLQDLLESQPGNPEALALLAAAEPRFVEQTYRETLTPESVPKLQAALETVMTMGLGPKEGFILSRINGSWDVRSILSVCPFREAESLLILRKLLDAKLIGF